MVLAERQHIETLDRLPQAARHYLAHIEGGLSIRELARRSGQHPSTILRQVRRIELQRDDPLIDGMLKRLSCRYEKDHSSWDEKGEKNMPSALEHSFASSEDFLFEAERALRRLCETGAVLAVATDMQKAVILRESADDTAVRTAILDRDIAEAMALKDWIRTDAPGRVTRYRITAAGRTALEGVLAAYGDDLDQPFDQRLSDASSQVAEKARRSRAGYTESPLSILARRRDKNGELFLTLDMVRSGERLREDFELSKMHPKLKVEWDELLSSTALSDAVLREKLAQSFDAQHQQARPSSPMGAYHRALEAFCALGPGLSDIALRSCCFLHGLEISEKALGWSARSGKIVLRIALMRLELHYRSVGQVKNDMIG